jgi:hypothetical protein
LDARAGAVFETASGGLSWRWCQDDRGVASQQAARQTKNRIEDFDPAQFAPRVLDQGSRDKEREWRNEVNCEENGHYYRPASVVYAKDAAGIPFRGGNGWHAAAKYAVFVCSRCLDAKEIEIAPVLEVRGNPDSGRKQELAAPKGKPLYDANRKAGARVEK